MSNSYWNFVTRMVAGSLAKADDVNSNLDGVTAGFTLVETEIDNAIKVTNAAGIVDIAQNAATRALKLISFDVNGDIVTSQIVGDWKGDHADAAGTDYQIRDVVKDAAGALGQNNLYICTVTHTSTGDMLTDTANWDLLVDVEAVAASETAAAASAAAAAASYDSFDDRYLGAKASAPTVDNDGDALITGALYFNSTSNLMYVRNSSAAWELTTANAVNVAITDASGSYTGTEVETALAEIGSKLGLTDGDNNVTVAGALTASGGVDGVLGGVTPAAVSGTTGTFTGAVSTTGLTMDAVAVTAWAATDGVKGDNFPAGTVMLFYQASPPTGWTTAGSLTNHALRVVAAAGTGGTGGGTLDFSTFLADVLTGPTTLTEAQMPYHTHTGTTNGGGAHNHTYKQASGDSSSGAIQNGTNNGTYASTNNLLAAAPNHTHGFTTASKGQNQSHTHSLAQDIKYADVIVASKD